MAQGDAEGKSKEDWDELRTGMFKKGIGHSLLAVKLFLSTRVLSKGENPSSVPTPLPTSLHGWTRRFINKQIQKKILHSSPRPIYKEQSASWSVF